MAYVSAVERLRQYFLVSLGLGVSGIVLGWMVENLLGQVIGILLTIVIPVSAMGWYVYQGVTIDRTNKSTDVFADSIYYLGFLLTLVALIFSLFAVNAEGDSTSGLVMRFGVALTTTVIGLGCRTYFANFKTTAEDEFYRLEEEVGRAARSLRDNSQQIAETMTLQSLAFGSALDGANAEVESAAEKIAKSVNKMTKLIDESADKVSTSLESLESGVESFTEDLGGTADRVSKRLDTVSQSLVKKVEEVELPEDFFEQVFEEPAANYSDRMSELTAEIKLHASAVSEVKTKSEQLASAITDITKELGDASSKAAGELEKSASAIETVNSHLDELAKSTDTILDAVQAHRDGISATSDTISSLHDEISQNGDLTSRHRQALEEELRGSREALSKMRGQLLEAAEYIHDELKA